MANREITCKLTGAIGPGINAHIVPRGLYNFRKGGGGQIVYVSSTNHRIKRSPTGIYDSEILTIEGESYFSNCDSYGAKFFVAQLESLPWKNEFVHPTSYPQGRARTLAVEHYDQFSIRYLCMSILWRASATSKSLFRLVDLGPHQARLGALLLRKDVGDIRDFSVILGKWDDTGSHGNPLLPPAPDRQDDSGINWIKFHLPYFSFAIKVDQRPLQAGRIPVVVGGSDRLVLFRAGNFRDSKAYKHFLSGMSGSPAKGKFP